MARTYPFEHFKVGRGAQSRHFRALDREHVAQNASPEPPVHGIHYGRAHPETLERARAHAVEHALEELAGAAKLPPPPPRRDRPRAQRAPAPAPPPPSGVPIGALPGAVEPQPPRSLGDFWDDGRRTLRGMETSARELWAGARRLARLPLDAARFVAAHPLWS